MTTLAAKPRIDWVDYAKGICIFFVVMLHCNDLVQYHVGAKGWLEHVVLFARPFRMPDFFLLAGLFVPRLLDKPWRDFVDRKVIHFLYLYAIWVTLQFIFFDARRTIANTGFDPNLLWAYAKLYIEPPGALWFIYILPVFFVLTRVTSAMPVWAVGLAAAMLHSAQIHTGWTMIDEFCSRYVFFFSGYALSKTVFGLAARIDERPLIGLAYLPLWAVINGTLVAHGVAAWPIVSLLLGYAGAAAVIVVAVLLSRLDWTHPLRYIGEHSVVIYLADHLVSVVVLRGFVPLIGDVGALAMAVTLGSVVGAVLLWWGLRATPLRILYRRPARWHLAG